jgi:hypothetical protein
MSLDFIRYVLRRSVMPEAAPWGRARLMDWARILAYVTGMVAQAQSARK